MFTVDPDFPVELAAEIYDYLKDTLRWHQHPMLISETTRKCIVHSMLVKICSFMANERNSTVVAEPVIEVESSLIWTFVEEKKTVRGRLDLSMIKAGTGGEPNDRTFFFVIEMKATTLYEAFKQCVVYLKRIRELNPETDVRNY